MLQGPASIPARSAESSINCLSTRPTLSSSLHSPAFSRPLCLTASDARKMQQIADIAKPLIQSIFNWNTKGTFHYYGTSGRLPYDNALHNSLVTFTIIHRGVTEHLSLLFQVAQLLSTVQLLTAMPPSGSQSLCTARSTPRSQRRVQQSAACLILPTLKQGVLLISDCHIQLHASAFLTRRQVRDQRIQY